MGFDPDIHHRRSIRLPYHDYSHPGAYFVTICIQDRECLLGNVENGRMILNPAGQMVESAWVELANRFPTLNLDQFIIMPNHLHGIIGITGHPECRGESCIRPPILGDHKDRPYGTLPNTVGRIIQALKSISTHRYVRGINEYHWPPFHKRLWQRNYYEHIIRDEVELNRIREYIEENPIRWEEDENHPGNVK